MALAARVDLSVDRIADAQLVIEALVDTLGRRSPDGVLDVVLAAGPAGVDLSVGPLPPGRPPRWSPTAPFPASGWCWTAWWTSGAWSRWTPEARPCA